MESRDYKRFLNFLRKHDCQLPFKEYPAVGPSNVRDVLRAARAAVRSRAEPALPVPDGRQREALSNLRYGLTTPRGLTLLIGEAGTGKTTLRPQRRSARCDGRELECVLLSNPTLTRVRVLRVPGRAVSACGRGGRRRRRGSCSSCGATVREAQAGMLNGLILDEAQSLPYELLEEVRLLSNIETPTEKLLNVVLAGQPELADRLNERRCAS